jgi:hypothetical protein
MKIARCFAWRAWLLTWIGSCSLVRTNCSRLHCNISFDCSLQRLASRIADSADTVRPVMLHIAESTAASFAELVAAGIHPRACPEEPGRGTYTQQSAAHKSIDECWFQPEQT